MGDLCYEISNQWLAQAVKEALSKLSWRDRTVLEARNAICHNCGGVKPMNEQYSFREISILIGSSTDKGAEKAYHTALDHLTVQMAEDNSIRVVDLVRIEPERVKKKNAAAIYQYQADCNGEWGEIHFDFEKGNAKIMWLADWDTSRSHLYAQKVIDCIMCTGGAELPKKKRIVFER